MAKVVYTVFVHVTSSETKVSAPLFPGVHFTSESMPRDEIHCAEYLEALLRLLRQSPGLLLANQPKTFSVQNVFIEVTRNN